MKDGSVNFNNEHGFEFLSYIYGELDQAGRDVFESHLTTCDECVLELAAYSDARLGVIEWRREDFDHLETPAIIVPWLSNKDAVANTDAEPAGLFQSFLGALNSLPIFAKAGMGVAAAALAIGMFYFATSSPAKKVGVAEVKSDQQVATQIQEPVSEPNQFVASSEGSVDKATEKNVATPSAHIRPVNVVRTVHPTFRRNELASNAVVKPNVTNIKKAPRLTTVEEEEDKSLRLADLFAEIGSSEE